MNKKTEVIVLGEKKMNENYRAKRSKRKKDVREYNTMLG